MKNIYTKPEMSIACFSSDDMVVTSGITSNETVAAPGEGAKTYSVDFNSFDWQNIDFTL